MAQHFLLSTQAIDLSLMKLFNMSENEAFEYLKLSDGVIQGKCAYMP